MPDVCFCLSYYLGPMKLRVHPLVNFFCISASAACFSSFSCCSWCTQWMKTTKNVFKNALRLCYDMWQAQVLDADDTPFFLFSISSANSSCSLLPSCIHHCSELNIAYHCYVNGYECWRIKNIRKSLRMEGPKHWVTV